MTQDELNKKIKDAEEQLSLLKKLQGDIQDSIAELTETLEQTTDDADGVEQLKKQVSDLGTKKKTVDQQVATLEDLIAQYKTMTPTNEVADAKQSNTMSEEEKARNAALAAQHPERVVDGIYYANDKALAKAKTAYEERIKAETQKANAEASAKVSNLAATMVAINQTLYGTDNAEVLAQLQGQVGGAELSSVLGNATTVRARQHLLNFKEFKHDFKAPNAGKPPNNKDPFPVDQKIEEVETHQPRVKVHEAITHNHGLEAMIVALQQFDATEKRLVRLENNLSTLTRYLFRLGSRVMINCHYYGGITTNQKYRCIRCMKDDRIGDAALVQIDQCLTCTRFEPIFGQVYEVLNDIGVNVAQVLDDLQASYMNSEDYVRMSRIEEYNDPLKQAKIDLTKILKDQSNDAAGLSDLWGEGIKMNWQLVPVEKQKPHINWRQAIDDDGSRLGRLASWQDVNSGLSPAITNALNNEQKTNVYIENKKAMDSTSLSAEISPYVTQGRKSVENETDQARTDYENAHKAARDAVGSGNDLDVLAVVAAGTVLATTDYASIVKRYRNVSSAISCSNPAVIWTAYNTSQSIAKMFVDGTLETYANPEQSADGKTSTTTKPTVTLIPEPTIIEHSYSWSSTPSSGNSPALISIHHTDGDETVEKIHEHHRDTNGWSGIGYHFVIYPNGEIHQGRQENMTPAAVEGHNTNSIAISLRGNYNNTEPSDEMWDALISLVAYVCKKYSITASRSTIKGHRDFSGHESNDCPGHKVFARLDDLVNAVSSGKISASKAERALWVDFADLYKKGIVKEGTSSPDGMFLFPSICYLYVKLMNDVKSSSFDGDSGWGFPFNEDTINADPEKSVFLTAPYGEDRGDHLHEGVDMATSQTMDRSKDIPFCAVKNGTVIISNQWCNGIYVKHPDGTYSRYLHCRRHLVQEGQTVAKGQNIGIVGGFGSTSDRDYDPHLHIEFGTQKNGDGLERSFGNDNCGLNPVDYWRKHTDTEGSYLVWKLS